MVEWPFAVSDGASRQMNYSICPKGIPFSRAGGELTLALDLKTEHAYGKILAFQTLGFPEGLHSYETSQNQQLFTHLILHVYRNYITYIPQHCLGNSSSCCYYRKCRDTCIHRMYMYVCIYI